ncbi:MAG: hypothetical protein ABSD71_14135 [Bacteroidales bacterium]|jgi:hypothetical protein
MKTKIIFALAVLLALFMAVNTVFSQKPEKVWSFVKVDKPFDWYITQAELWKKVIDKDPKNAAAWVNFYTANRMASSTNNEAWQKKKGPGYMALGEIVKEMKDAIPGTYEYYDVELWNDGYQNEQNAADLLKAYAMEPDRPDIYSSLLNYFEKNRDSEHLKEVCRKWFDSNDLSSGILNYNYNVLQSLDDNAIIITNADMDTYPLWILQYALGIKKHVVVVNINLVTVDSYRKKLFEENNIPVDDFQGLDQPKQEKIIQHIITNSSRPVYFANTLRTRYYEAFKKDLYLVGLAFKYSKKSFDNIAVIRNNYERNFFMDYVNMNFNNDISQSIVDQFNMGYLPMMVKLNEHYTLSGESEKAAGVKKLGLFILKKVDPDAKPDELFKKD